MKILVGEEGTLRTKCRKVTLLDIEMLTQLESELLHKVKSLKAAGLAANQVGFDVAAAVFLDADGTYRAIYNPHILQLSKPTKMYERCLSLPIMPNVQVTRAQEVVLEFETLDSIKKGLPPLQETFTNFTAQIIQHEVDHLNGKLYIDQLKAKVRQAYLSLNKKHKDLFEAQKD
jgi:peptide deformylase